MTAAETINYRKQKFYRAFHFVLVSEGGTNNDPVDRGGLTNWGISQKQYPKLNIENLSLSTARDIYYTDYWLRNKCDQMNPDLGVIVFDSSVNCGQASGAKWVQRACNKLGSDLIEDGVIGSKTLHELYKYSQFDIQELVLASRLRRYVNLLSSHPKQVRFIKGWISRVSNLLEFVSSSNVESFKN